MESRTHTQHCRPQDAMCRAFKLLSCTTTIASRGQNRRAVRLLWQILTSLSTCHTDTRITNMYVYGWCPTIWMSVGKTCTFTNKFQFWNKIHGTWQIWWPRMATCSGSAATASHSHHTAGWTSHGLTHTHTCTPCTAFKAGLINYSWSFCWRVCIVVHYVQHTMRWRPASTNNDEVPPTDIQMTEQQQQQQQ